MLHMQRIGIRELRQQASAVLRRVAGGETFEITDRGRIVALLVGATRSGLAALDEQGLVRSGEGDLLAVEPFVPPPGSVPPSRVVAAGRED